MKTFVTMLALMALATTSIAQMGDREGMMRRMGAGMVLGAADVDGNREVTADEWKKFTGSLADENGAVNLSALQSSLIARALDLDKNGKLEKADLEKPFTALDKDSDGAITEEEMRAGANRRRGARGGRGGEDGEGRRRRGGDEGEGQGRRRRRADGEDGQGGEDGANGGRGGRGGEGNGRGRGMGRENRNRRGDMLGRMLTRAVLGSADADQSRSISADEWGTFMKNVSDEQTGAIDAAKLTTVLTKERAAPEGEGNENGRRMRRMFSVKSMLGQKTFDADSDGKLAQADFDKMFKDMDRDESGVVTAEELRPQSGNRGNRRERPGFGGRDGGKDV